MIPLKTFVKPHNYGKHGEEIRSRKMWSTPGAIRSMTGEDRRIMEDGSSTGQRGVTGSAPGGGPRYE